MQAEDPVIKGGQEEERDIGAEPGNQQEEKKAGDGCFSRIAPGAPVVYIEEEKSDRHIESAVPLDAGGPEQGGGQQEAGEGGQGCIGELIPEEPEKGCISQEYGKGKQQGIDIKIVEREEIEE